jgi:hypothetical protein
MTKLIRNSQNGVSNNKKIKYEQWLRVDTKKFFFLSLFWLKNILLISKLELINSFYVTRRVWVLLEDQYYSKGLYCHLNHRPHTHTFLFFLLFFTTNCSAVKIIAFFHCLVFSFSFLITFVFIFLCIIQQIYYYFLSYSLLSSRFLFFLPLFYSII